MSIKNLNWALPDQIRSLGVLPVRFHTAEGEIVASGLSGRNIEVPPGQFYLGVTLPNGHEVIGSQVVDTFAPSPQLPTLAAEIGRLIERTPFSTWNPAATQTRSLTELTTEPMPTTQMSRYRGDWVAALGGIDSPGSVTSFADLQDSILLDAQPVLIERGDSLDELCITVDDGIWRAFVIPYDRPLECWDGKRLIEARLGRTGARVVFTSHASPETNAFIEFVATGLLSESQRLSIDLIERGGSAIAEGASSLLHSILGAYVLLRANQTDYLVPCTERLVAAAPDCPDTHVLRMETMARQGDHEQALYALRRACVAGCPWFRSGIGYQLERLKFYRAVDQGSSPFNLSDDDRALFDVRLARLERMAARMDLRSLFSAFQLPIV